MLMVTNTLIGSPMLFEILIAIKEWLQSHPLSVHTSPCTASTNTDPAKHPRIAQGNKTVCRFFTLGSCKFGSKCRNYHPGASQPDRELEHDMHHNQEETSETSGNIQLPNALEIPINSAMKKEIHHGKGKEEKKGSMRTAADVISRVRWDPALPTEKFTIGYLDRFVGIIEKPFNVFSWENLATVAPDVLAVPEHRIQYFKYLDEVVWDKMKQLDNVFGSRGGKLIQDVILAYSSDVTENCENKKVRKVKDSVSQRASKRDRNEPVTRYMQERPTHFVCIRVTDQELVSHVERIHGHVTNHSPHLADSCSPLTALHVTICMLQIKTSSQMDTAKKVMENTKQFFVQYIPKSTDLEFSGVDHFNDRVLYGKVVHNTALDRLSFLLIERFQDAGLKTPGNHDKYTPHMTLAKLSRPTQRDLNTAIIHRDSYRGQSETFIGKQPVDGIYLCAATGPKEKDGFYPRLHFISNSLLNLSPLASSLFSKLACLLHENGLHSARELEFSEGNIHMFDNSVKSIERLVNSQSFSHSISNTKRSKVIILRGLPGSGKSYLTKHSLGENTAVCSSDGYFRDKFGAYNFNRKLLPEAHSYCCQQFLQAISDRRKLVVVDNTNSMKWEYEIYVYLCRTQGLQCHILEIPHPNNDIVSAFCSRNVHNIDMVTIKSFTDRWEEEKEAVFVPPWMVYPIKQCTQTDKSLPSSAPTQSILNICQADAGILPEEISVSPTPLEVFFTGIFLTARAQWELVSAVAPTHTEVYAEHVTLAFKPSIESVESLNIGKEVRVTVWGVGDDGEVQAVTVATPDGIVSQNEHPHITISTIPSSAPKFSNDMLSSHPAMRLSCHLVLDGIIGVAVKGSVPSDDEESDTKNDVNGHSSEKYFPILSKEYFNDKVAPRLCRTPHNRTSVAEDSSISIFTGTTMVTELFVYDFDGTLFDSPYPAAGKQVYKTAMGQSWPYKGWWNVAESLLPPLKVPPGPALASFRAHCGRSGSHTVILTARIQSTAAGVEHVLTNYNIHSDELIMKPNNTSECKNTEYKVAYLHKLLDRFPNAKLVKLWEDNATNLEAMESFAKTYGKGVKFDIINATQMNHFTRTPASIEASVLMSFLNRCGFLSTPEHRSAAQTGVRFIAEQFALITHFKGNPNALALVCGSHCFGRKSDVDLCLLAPPHLTPVDCMEKLSSQLGKCGIKSVHKGHSSRCPRLKIKLDFKETPSIEYDIVFAILASTDLFSSCESLSIMSGLDKQLKENDQASKKALMGPILRHRVQDIIRGTVSCESFGVVLETIVTILKAYRLKGNCYRCIRTYHIVQLMANFISTHKKVLSGGSSEEVSCDILFKEFVVHSAQLVASTWESLCAEGVSHEYIPRLMDTFQTLFKTLQMNSGDSIVLLFDEAMNRRPFPPQEYIPVTILCRANNYSKQWELDSVLEARLPTYISNLFSCGLDVIPDGNEVCGGVCFAVRNTNSSKEIIQDVFRKLWSEFSTYHKQKEIHMELKFSISSYLDRKDGIGMDSASNSVYKVQEFMASEQSDLHLPATLTSYERRLVHEEAERLHLHHKTEGTGKERHIHLYK